MPDKPQIYYTYRDCLKMYAIHAHRCVALLPSIEFKHLRQLSGYPKEIVTLGDHIHAVRLDRGLRQKDVATRLGVSAWTVMNWENNYHEPDFRFYPAIMNFLEYCPVQHADNLGGWVRIHRQHCGISQGHAAQMIGIDPSTLRKYEQGARVPWGKYFTVLEQFVRTITH